MSEQGAIITGAASGIGLALTKHLLDQGWRVVMTDINPIGETIAMDLGVKVLWIECNIADWDSQVSMFAKAFAWCKNITFLAANAGISTNMAAQNSIMSLDSEKPPLQVLEVNLQGTVYNIKLFLHHVHLQDPSSPIEGESKAKIVITGSEGGLYALPLDPIYSASKHALVGLTRSLGPSLTCKHGITINSINPGFVHTPFAAHLILATPDEYVTPMTTIIQAFDQLLNSNETGQVVEASGTNLYYQEQQPYPDEIARWVWEDGPTFWSGLLAHARANS